MSNVTLFGENNLSSMLADIPNVTDAIAGGGSGSTSRRVSIKGNVFREMINGKEFRVNEDRAMNVVVVRASEVSRMFFAGSYSEGAVAKPTCWSSNSREPDQSVPADQKQAHRCIDCPQNIKGSGAGEGRACRFQQRLAVMLEGGIESREVYQITLPATSIFGEGTKDKMPLQAFGKYLRAHNTNILSIITEMRFDTASPTPKLIFRAIRSLTGDELNAVVEMLEHPDTVKAITLSVSSDKPADSNQSTLFTPPVAKLEPPKAAAPAPKAEPVVDEEVEEEPKKVVKKSATVVPPASVDLAAIVDNWDD